MGMIILGDYESACGSVRGYNTTGSVEVVETHHCIEPERNTIENTHSPIPERHRTPSPETPHGSLSSRLKESMGSHRRVTHY